MVHHEGTLLKRFSGIICRSEVACRGVLCGYDWLGFVQPGSSVPLFRRKGVNLNPFNPLQVKKGMTWGTVIPGLLLSIKQYVPFGCIDVEGSNTMIPHMLHKMLCLGLLVNISIHCCNTGTNWYLRANLHLTETKKDQERHCKGLSSLAPWESRAEYC